MPPPAEGFASRLVTEQTEIECGSQDVATASHDGEEEPGDDSGDEGPGPEGGPGQEGDDDNGDGNSGPGSSDSGPGGDDDNGAGANCTAADLTDGATVKEAELKLENGSATFEKVELAG